MTRRPKLWFVGASLFALINLAGAGLAIASGEWLHTAAHVGLLVPAVYFARRLAPQLRRQHPSSVELAGDRLDHLQQSLDAVALEVERIGEAQRFMTKIVAERGATVPRKEHRDPAPDEPL